MSDEMLNFNKRITVEATFNEVDPELIGLLTGTKVVNGMFVYGTPNPPEMSMTFYSPIKRTFWQWLTRKPKRQRMVHLPRVRVEQG